MVWCDRVSCVSDVLPLLASCDRVFPGRTVYRVTVWSGRTVLGSGRTVTWSSALPSLGSYRVVSYRIVSYRIVSYRAVWSCGLTLWSGRMVLPCGLSSQCIAVTDSV